MSLNICEIFYSLQGESTYSGLPCIFIRLSGCNLRCSWCDTTYAWSNGKEMSFEQILQEIRKYPCSLVEITGGEPLLQKRTIELMEVLHQEKYRILLETNGTQYLQNVPDYVVKIVDVKCPGSGFGESFLTENLNFLLPVDEIKFVLASREDYMFALNFIRNNALEDRILLFSPVIGHLAPETLAQWMLKDGVPAHLQLQLHKLLQLA
jgi:7-carboxy-7-deazaguanine synthase